MWYSRHSPEVSLSGLQAGRRGYYHPAASVSAWEAGCSSALNLPSPSNEHDRVFNTYDYIADLPAPLTATTTAAAAAGSRISNDDYLKPSPSSDYMAAYWQVGDDYETERMIDNDEYAVNYANYC